MCTPWAASSFHMITGAVVFPAETASAAARRHIEDRPPDPRAVRPATPVWLAQLILRLLEKEPGRRPAGAAEVAQSGARTRRHIITNFGDRPRPR
jgi:eukaryotic-like serine/threonine-protein kinase